jgi:hypothetical protein
MADEPENLVLVLLQEIRSSLAGMKAVQTEHSESLAEIKETLRLHGIRLSTHTATFEDIGRATQELKDMLRRIPSNAELARDLRALEACVEALEGRRS